MIVVTHHRHDRGRQRYFERGPDIDAVSQALLALSNAARQHAIDPPFHADAAGENEQRPAATGQHLATETVRRAITHEHDEHGREAPAEDRRPALLAEERLPLELTRVGEVSR